MSADEFNESDDEEGDTNRLPARPVELAREQRFPVDWRVCFRCPDWKTVSRVAAENASRGGLFLMTTRPPRIGSRVELVLSLPDGSELTVRATVQHIVTPERAAEEKRSPGFGVRVDEPHATDMILLEQMALAASAEPTVVDAAPPSMVPPEPPANDPTPPQGKPAIKPPVIIGRHARGTGPAVRTVGIDLGSTFASIALSVPGSVWLGADEDGRTRHPSVVHFPVAKDAAPVAGWKAREHLIDDPRHTIAGARRLLGKQSAYPQISAWLHAQAFRTGDGASGELTVDVDGTQHDPTQICAHVVRHLRTLAEQQLGRELVEAAVACPVGFGVAETQALRRAVELAGLRVVDLVPEPVAAALAVGAGQASAELVGVFDWGGGRCDFSLVEIAPGMARVVGFESDSSLSGDNLDQALAGAVADALWRSSGVELRRRVSDWQRLILACEDARRALSVVEITQISLTGGDGVTAETRLTHRVDRSLLERLTEEPLERSLGCVRLALSRAGLQADALDRFVVVGGLASSPFVRAALGKRFARAIDEIRRPDEIIARGAAVFAASLGERVPATRRA